MFSRPSPKLIHVKSNCGPTEYTLSSVPMKGCAPDASPLASGAFPSRPSVRACNETLLECPDLS